MSTSKSFKNKMPEELKRYLMTRSYDPMRFDPDSADADLRLQLLVKEAKIIRSAFQERKSLGLTQLDISARTGMPQQAVSRLELALRSPTLLSFLKYLDATGLELKVFRTSDGQEVDIPIFGENTVQYK